MVLEAVSGRGRVRGLLLGAAGAGDQQSAQAPGSVQSVGVGGSIMSFKPELIPLVIWRCPICHAEDSLTYSNGGMLVRRRTIRCTSCGAVWDNGQYRFTDPNTGQEIPNNQPAATVAFVQLPLNLGGTKASLGAQLLAPSDVVHPDLRWGVNGTVSLGVVTPYFEVGTGQAEDKIFQGRLRDYQVVGVKLDVLRQALGLDALAEYDIAGKKFFARVGREALPGLWVHLRRETDESIRLRTEVSISF